ncbi:YhcH/YjgK/YiaL family protein [Streptococcus ovis]|uniref:YhcH/YjgK/YiaL family protein n=1 Tax=Streptococcus ovis TaxID=82806 RepID=UPI000375181A|nr:YhcH/YjgK/YiaL family protein [Streptococcus ovis]
MLFDTLNQLQRYQGLHPNLDTALHYLMSHNLKEKANGTYTVEGNKVFFFIQENQLNQDTSQEFEYHHHYLDLHFLLEGTEIIQFGHLVDQVTSPYDEIKDIGMVTCQEHTTFHLTGDDFVAFFPGEAHQPNQYSGQETHVKKCVFKVLID